MRVLQLEKMKHDNGFIAALDQSGGSTPKALTIYGIPKDAYENEDQMYQLVHKMRTRIMTSPVFTSERILATILFEKTMDLTVEDEFTADYLWNKKGIISILKVDQGLQDLESGVQLMKPIPQLAELLRRAKAKNIFGTKMRSVIKEANEEGIKAIVSQQFQIAKVIIEAGLVPVLEPEVDIHAPEKEQIEVILKRKIVEELKKLKETDLLMFKLTLPAVDDFYHELLSFSNVIRVVALSGGYTRAEANEILARNHGLIASFSRALTEGLRVDQTEEEFNAMLDSSIQSIFEASIT